VSQDSITRRKRLRGWLVVGFRNRITKPLAQRIPVSVLRRTHRLRRRVRPEGYTDANPFALVDVDPDRIERSLLEAAPPWPQWGRVVGGDWDQWWKSFDERGVPKGIEQRFIEGKPWPETALYDAYVDQLERFGNAWEYTSIDGFEQRCREVERLYESIRTKGYRRQAELRDDGNTIGTRADEINVDIGRDGTVYWRTYGQHRLAIAKLLDAESVPVLVHRRHRRWQEVRDQVREQGRDAVNEAYRDHPDLGDIDRRGPS